MKKYAVGMMFVAVVNWGCTQSQGGTDAGNSTPLTAAELADWAVQFDCKFQEVCNGPGETCTAHYIAQSRSVSLAAFETAIAQKRIAVTRSQLPNFDSINCEKPLKFPDIGLVTPGGECNIDFECTKGNYCSGTTCPGKCAALIANDGTCSASPQCESGNCDYSSGKCRASASLNQACGSIPCSQGLTCLQTQDGGSTCQVRASRFTLERGAACTIPSGEFPQTLCKSGLACISADGGQQGTCGSPVGEGGSCPTYTECDENTICWGFTCKKFSGLNERCAEDTCAPGLNCNLMAGGHGEGLCVTAKALGETCSNRFDCASRYCSKDGKCAPLNVCPGK